ncbi:MAG: hypothetical protein M1814_005104 [Vezdaea aestivalis]|nr:MAG: hypothetical protein M1814_005104 [Vezdaea aestivalis]
MPYFAARSNFQIHSGQKSHEHDDIPCFEAAYLCTENGFRQAFRQLRTNFEGYHTLCSTLDYLCVDTLGGRSIDTIFEDLRSGKGFTNTDYKRSFYVKSSRKTARDSAFRLVYFLLNINVEDNDDVKMAQKLHQMVLFVTSHRGIFRFTARKIVRAAYEERIQPTAKQEAALDKWPILEPENDAEYSTEDEKTDGIFDYDSDFDSD